MDSMRCQYASKPCDQPRTFKDNGELHRLCLYHRTRANDAQRRWHSRQRCAETGSDAEAALTKTAPKKASTTDASARTKRRRRATEKTNKPTTVHPYRRPQVMLKALASADGVPASPPAVDSAAFSTSFGTLDSFSLPPSDQERLSAEDLALLDELMMTFDATPPPVSGLTMMMTPFADALYDTSTTSTPLLFEEPMQFV